MTYAHNSQPVSHLHVTCRTENNVKAMEIVVTLYRLGKDSLYLYMFSTDNFPRYF
jgi:hypothetical protein